MAKVIKNAPKPTADPKKDQIIEDLIEVMAGLGLNVRTEKGTFKGGCCLLREQKLFLLNKSLEQDKKINLLVRTISGMGVEGIYLKPNIRELIEKEDGDDKLL